MAEAQKNRPVFAGGLIIVAMVILGLIDNYIKVIAGEAGLWEFHVTRSVVVVVSMLILARVFHWRLRPKNWRPVIARSLILSLAMVLYFGALAMMPIAQVGAGMFSSPIFVLVLSTLFFGVRVGIRRILAVALGFTGVILILRPDVGGLSLLSAMPVLAGLLYAISTLATRHWCAQESTGTLLMGSFVSLGIWGVFGVAYFSVFPVSPEIAEIAPFFTQGWVAPTGLFIFWMLVQAYGSLVSVALLTRGYQSGDASFVSLFEYSFLITAGGWGYLLFGEIPDLRATIGIVAIIAAGMIIALRSR